MSRWVTYLFDQTPIVAAPPEWEMKPPAALLDAPAAAVEVPGDKESK